MIYLHKIRILIYANIYYTMVKSFRRKNVHRVRRKSSRNNRIHNNAKELGMMGAVLGFSALQTNSGSEHEGAAGAGAEAGAQELMAGGRGGRGSQGGRGGKSLDASVLILTFMEILNQHQKILLKVSA